MIRFLKALKLCFKALKQNRKLFSVFCGFLWLFVAFVVFLRLFVAFCGFVCVLCVFIACFFYVLKN
jgi:hypothetical protein